MGIDGEINVERIFRKGITAAKKRAGRIVGRKMVKDRVDGIISANKARQRRRPRQRDANGRFLKDQFASGAISRRRKKAVRHIVGKDGTLVFLDHAPMAASQEFGETIRAKRGRLFIQDRRRRVQAGEKVFITKKGTVMAVKSYDKQNKRKATPRIIGSLRPQIQIKRLPKAARMTYIASKYMNEYSDEIEKQLNKQNF